MQSETSQSLRQEIPVHPWTKLATDIFHFESSSYLLIVDYASRFPVVCKLVFHDRFTCCKSLQANIFWIWMAWDPNFWLWSMLYFISLHQCYAVLQCQSYYQLSALPIVKWSCWEVCPDCEKLVLQSKGRRQRFFQVFDDLLHPPCRYYAVIYADSSRQEC